MPNDKNWLLGRDLTALDLYTGTRDAATGVVTWGVTPVTLVNRADYVRVGDDRTLEMITPVNATQAHYEKVMNDSSLVIGEIMRRSGSVLAMLAQTSDLVKARFTRGNGTYVYHGTIRSFNDGVVAYGKNANEITLAQVDVLVSGAPLTYSEA